MVTAFQRNAFQNNAFQIDFNSGDGGGGGAHGSGRKKRGLTSKDVSDLLEEYKKAFESDVSKETKHKIISAVNPFIIPETEDEIARNNRAQFLFDDLPPPKRIDFNLLQQNSIYLERLTNSIRAIREAQEEEALIMLITMLS